LVGSEIFSIIVGKKLAFWLRWLSTILTTISAIIRPLPPKIVAILSPATISPTIIPNNKARIGKPKTNNIEVVRDFSFSSILTQSPTWALIGLFANMILVFAPMVAQALA